MSRFLTHSSLNAASAVMLITALVCCGSQRVMGSAATDLVIHWTPDSSETNRYSVDVLGVDTATLLELQKSTEMDWAGLLSVYAEQGNVMEDIGLPSMVGSYTVDDRSIRFRPQFALVPGVNYRAVLHPRHLPGQRDGALEFVEARVLIPVPDRTPSTVVRQIYPSGDALPENLLKFYLHFSASMSGGQIYQHIHLFNDSGGEVELPFLELDEELWNSDMTRLTLFIDPGRIKREVRPLEEIGPALEQGKRFTLVIERNWQDAQGDPLKTAFNKSFHVAAPDRDPPDPEQWVITSPPRATRTPLTIDFGKPMDHALAQRMIHVTDATGEVISGTASLTEHEQRWVFKPDQPWSNGTFAVVVQTTIEDLAGNNIGKPFEVDLFEGVQRRLTSESVRIAFEVD